MLRSSSMDVAMLCIEGRERNRDEAYTYFNRVVEFETREEAENQCKAWYLDRLEQVMAKSREWNQHHPIKNARQDASSVTAINRSPLSHERNLFGECLMYAPGMRPPGGH
ncbi:MAG: hypothetical protein NC311_15365 [Muribaculaceae bacterium]|nr:hypothetical protein [Muribaculaceae bacterium]